MNNVKKVLSALAVSAVLVTPLNTQAASINLGTAADFTILALENGRLSINSATSLTGNVGYSAGVITVEAQKVDTFTGTAFVNSGFATTSFNNKYVAATFAPSGGIQYGPGLVDNKLHQANLDAMNAASFYAGLIPAGGSARDLGNLGDNDNRTLNGTGLGLNIYRLGSLNYNSDVLTLIGGANDVFVFDVTGNFDFSQSQIVLTGGITANNVLFNFLTGSSGHVDLNKAANEFYGTILSPSAPIDYHNPATFVGRLIGTNITLHSDFNLQGPGNQPGGSVPDTGSTLALMGIGMAMLVAVKRKFLS